MHDVTLGDLERAAFDTTLYWRRSSCRGTRGRWSN